MSRRYIGIVTRCVFGFFLTISLIAFGQERERIYPLEPVYTPELQRPAIQFNMGALPERSTGRIPQYDGEPMNLITPFDPKSELNMQSANAAVDNVLRGLGWTRQRNEIRFMHTSVTPETSREYLEQFIKDAEEADRRRLTGRFGKINEETENALRELAAELRRQADARSTLFSFDQYVNNIPVDNTGLRIYKRTDEGSLIITGRLFNSIRITNSRRLSSADAVRAAREHAQKHTQLRSDAESKPEAVLLPYGEAFRHAWKFEIAAIEGSYMVWLDAANGNVLQLEPLFHPNNARGLVFNPVPDNGTVEKAFSINPASGGTYRLRLNNVLETLNGGADGCTGVVTVSDDGSGTANFNVSPINGTVVDRTNDSNYNCRFQEVNVYAWVYDHLQLFNAIGSETFAMLETTVNHDNPCGFGVNNACATHDNRLIFGIGNATTGTGTGCLDRFNSAIDATVVTHEFGHILNRIQYAVSGGTITSSMHEGLADYWAMTVHTNDMIGNFFGDNCTGPFQTGRIPRQADPADIFPHLLPGTISAHGDGQIIAWALWSARQELLASSILGSLSLSLNLLKAMTTAGQGVLAGSTDRRIHDAYLDLLEQLAPLYGSSRSIHKILTGFARAGVFLSERDAVIDIDDDYLNRNTATGPTFSVWTGRDYTFTTGGSATTSSPPFNTRFTIEVATNESFTDNLVSSGVQSGVSNGMGGNATWTLPTSDWNTLKAHNQIYYRVRTTNTTGGTVRESANPGNGFLTGVPAARAIINESGRCECATASAADNPAAVFVLLMPLAAALIWRWRTGRP